MLKQSALIILIFYILINYCNSSLPDDIANIPAECLTNSVETSIYCRGTQVINNVINNLSKTHKPIVIVRGLEIVPSTNSHNNHTAKNYNENNKNNNNGTAGAEGDNLDDTLLERFSRYLRTHELNIKFSDLMSSDKSELYLTRDPEQSGMQMNSSYEGRKKDKGGSIIIALGLMMSKIMAVMGLGSIGALAMKALGVALTALMMAAMVGLKSLAHHGHDSSHSVQYVKAEGHHHKRRRRSSNNSIFTGAELPLTTTQLPSLVYKEWHK